MKRSALYILLASLTMIPTWGRSEEATSSGTGTATNTNDVLGTGGDIQTSSAAYRAKYRRDKRNARKKKSTAAHTGTIPESDSTTTHGDEGEYPNRTSTQP